MALTLPEQLSGDDDLWFQFCFLYDTKMIPLPQRSEPYTAFVITAYFYQSAENIKAINYVILIRRALVK